MSRGKMKKVFAVFRVLTFPPYGWDFLKKIFSAGEKQAQSVVLHPVGNGKKAVPPAASAAVPNAPIHSERKYQFSGVPIRLDEWGRNGCMPFRKTQSTQTERHEVVISPHCSGTMGTPQYLILALLGRRYSSPFGTTQRSFPTSGENGEPGLDRRRVSACPIQFSGVPIRLDEWGILQKPPGGGF